MDLNNVQRTLQKLDQNRILDVQTKHVCFETVCQQRWPFSNPFPSLPCGFLTIHLQQLILRNLNGKKIFGVLYHDYDFRVHMSTKMAVLTFDWPTHFRPLCNRWAELAET